jgi:hypothetical protein
MNKQAHKPIPVRPIRKSAEAPMQQAVLVETHFADSLRADLYAARRESRLLNLVICLALVILVLICTRAPSPRAYVGRAMDGTTIALVDTTVDAAYHDLTNMPHRGTVIVGSDGTPYKLVVGNWFPTGVRNIHKYSVDSVIVTDTTPSP